MEHLRSANFNSHAHVERDEMRFKIGQYKQNFNSHAHVERDDYNSSFSNGDEEISTHTLTWSVTQAGENAQYTEGFQLTRSRGA